MMLFVSLFVFCLFFFPTFCRFGLSTCVRRKTETIYLGVFPSNMFFFHEMYIYTCIYIYIDRYICFLNSMHPNKKISLVPSGAGLQQES